MASQNIAIQIHLPSKSVIVILVALEQATQISTRFSIQISSSIKLQLDDWYIRETQIG